MKLMCVEHLQLTATPFSLSKIPPWNGFKYYSALPYMLTAFVFQKLKYIDFILVFFNISVEVGNTKRWLSHSLQGIPVGYPQRLI
jgi:hypothetical protein